MIRTVTFSDFAKSYVFSRGLAHEHGMTLRRRAAALEKFVGERQLDRVLSEMALNDWLAELSDTRTPATVRGYRADILTLWHAAAEDGLVTPPVTRHVLRPRVPDPIVECYVADEARMLVKWAADHARDLVPYKLAQKPYWNAIIRAAWDTGLRRSDLWRLQRAQIRHDGRIVASQSKTGHRVVTWMRKNTVAAIDAMMVRPGLPIFRWPYALTTFSDQFREIVHGSGVNRGTFKWLRRAAGSHVESLSPGAGVRYLGHTNPQTFYRHYDAAMVGGEQAVRPPEL